MKPDSNGRLLGRLSPEPSQEDVGVTDEISPHPNGPSMRDKARNTHPAVRQAKLLRYVVGPSVRRGVAAAATAAAVATAATVKAGGGATRTSGAAGETTVVSDLFGYLCDESKTINKRASRGTCRSLLA